MSASTLEWAPITGLATCARCGWRGVPTRHGRTVSHTCPTCESGIQTDAEYAKLVAAEAARVKYGKAGRNDPCPCGSGRKAKRCHPELT